MKILSQTHNWESKLEGNLFLIYSIIAEPKQLHHNVNFDLPDPIFDSLHIFTNSQGKVERKYTKKMCVLISDNKK